MKPLTIFRDAVRRAIILVDLHDLLLNTKNPLQPVQEGRYKHFLGWKPGDDVVRVGSKASVLVFRNHPRLEIRHFSADGLSDLLRAALVAGVSALDRFMHDLIVYHSLTLLRRSTKDVPRDLAGFPIPLGDAEAAVSHALDGGAKAADNPRPRTTLKEKFRTALHRETFQSSREIERAFAMLGASKCWTRLAAALPGSAESLKRRLDAIVWRRNQIVHEGDMVRAARPQAVKLHPTKSSDTRDDLIWIKSFCIAVDEIAEDCL